MSNAGAVSVRHEMAHGYPVLVGGLICYALSVAAIPTYTNGVYMKALAAEFGVGRDVIAGVWLIKTLGTLVMAPNVGVLADRFGAHWLAAISLAAMAAVYMAMGTVMHTFGHYVLLTIALSIAGAATLPVVFTKPVMAWFNRARGLALGCVLVGTGLTAIIAPPVLSRIVEADGWQAGFRATSIAICVGIPVVFLLLRAPKDGAVAHGGSRAATGPEVSLKEAVSRPVFWLLAGAFALQSMASVGYVAHLMPLLTDGGMSAVDAASIATVSGVAIVCGRFFVGPLMDHIFAPWIAMAVAALFGFGCLLLAYGGVAFAPISAFLFGLVIGAEVDFISFLVARYFGFRHYGRIYGCLYALYALGAGIGSVWIGAVFERTGSYHLTLIIASVMSAGVIVLLTGLPRYGRPAVFTDRTAAAEPLASEESA